MTTDTPPTGQVHQDSGEQRTHPIRQSILHGAFTESGGGRGRHQQGGNDGQDKKFWKERECFSCGKTEHLSPNCPSYGTKLHQKEDKAKILMVFRLCPPVATRQSRCSFHALLAPTALLAYPTQNVKSESGYERVFDFGLIEQAIVNLFVLMGCSSIARKYFRLREVASCLLITSPALTIINPSRMK